MVWQRSFSALHRIASAGRSAGSWLVLCCTLVAIALGGMTSTVVGVLGSTHTHGLLATHDARALGSPAPELHDFRRADPINLASHGDPHAHDHSHLSLQRHHHDPADASVQSVDAAAEGDTAASAATGVLMLLIFGTICLWRARGRIARAMRWMALRCQPIPSGHALPLERPPRA